MIFQGNLIFEILIGLKFLSLLTFKLSFINFWDLNLKFIIVRFYLYLNKYGDVINEELISFIS